MPELPMPTAGAAAAEPRAGRRLTPTERRHWTLRERHGLALHGLFEIESRRPIAIDRLRAVLRDLVARHEALRTQHLQEASGTGGTGGAAASEPSAVVIDRVEPAIEGLPGETTTSAIKAREEEIALRGADASAWAGAARFTVAPLSDGRVRLFGVVPAINADRRSLQRLAEEIDAACRRADADDDAAEAAGEVPFGEVAGWLAGQADAAPAEAFWRRHLAAAGAPTALPIEARTDQGDAPFSPRAAAWDLPIAADAVADTVAEAELRAEAVSAAAIWLSRLTGAPRVTIAVACDGRSYDELREAVGPYEKYVPLDVAIEPGMTVAQVRAAVGARLEELTGWQDWFDLAHGDRDDLRLSTLAAFPLCVDVRQGPAEPRDSGLLDAGSNGAAAGAAASASAGAGAAAGEADEALFIVRRVSSVPDVAAIVLVWERRGARLHGAIQYDAARYTADAIARLQAQLDTVLAAMRDRPSAPVDTLDLLGAAERAWLQAIASGDGASGDGVSGDEASGDGVAGDAPADVDRGIAAGIGTGAGGRARAGIAAEAKARDGVGAGIGARPGVRARVADDQPHDASPTAFTAAAAAVAAASMAEAAAAAVAAPAMAPDEPFHHAFERHAAAAGDAIAMAADRAHLSYRCLDRLANRLARRLRAAAPIGPEARVGVRLRTSMEANVAILAVLKCGAAYVPLDPAWPASRSEAVLREAGIRILLTAAGTGASVSAASTASTSTAATAVAAVAAVEGAASKSLNDGRQAAAEPILEIPCDLRALWRDAAADEPSRAGDTPGALDAHAARPGVPVDPDHLAYVLYTSGSTGAPKGALITHRGLSNYLAWSIERYGLARGRGAVVHSPLTFDFTLTCLLGPLAAGRCVFLSATEDPLDGLADTLARLESVSAIKLTPTAVDPLRRLLLSRNPGCRVDHIVLGGEALLAGRALWALALSLGAAVTNEYGPTECVVGSSAFRLDPAAPGDGPVPIGRPIARTRLRLATDDGRLAPSWMPGELFIGGAGVARGYLARPSLTAASFTPDPDGAPGARLYRTGDRAWRQSSGDLVYLGRRDSQVKIRGHRVELTEVEGALRRHPAVADAAVTIAERPDTHAALLAFLVLEPGAAVDQAALRAHLAAWLPDYMTPSAFHVVPALPATVNGKIDQRALREAIEQAARPAARTIVAPRTEAERILHRLWCDLLGKPEISVDDHFFELGGDSILAIQLLARAKEAGLQLRPRNVQEQPTIAGLAEAAQRAAAGAAGRAAGLASGNAPEGSPGSATGRATTAIAAGAAVDAAADPASGAATPGGTASAAAHARSAADASAAEAVRSDAAATNASAANAAAARRIPLTPIQRRFFDSDLRHPHHYTQALLLQSSRTWAAADALAAVRALVAHHDALRLSFDRDGQEWYQRGAAHAARDVVTFIDGTVLSDEEWTRHLARASGEAMRSMDLRQPPLLRVLLCARRATAPPLVLLVCHHLIVDHVSWIILLEDLRAALRQADAGRPIQLTPVTASYAGWADAIARDAQTRNWQAERAYWLSDRWDRVPPLPFDYPDEPDRHLVAHEASVSVTLGREETTAWLEATSAAYQTRPFDLLVTACALAHAHWTGARALIVDLERHGRNGMGGGDDGDGEPDVSRTVGWFTAIHPVLLTLSQPGDPRRAIREVKEALRAVPADGATYGAWRYVAADAPLHADCARRHAASLAINFLGLVDRAAGSDDLFTWAGSPAGEPRSPWNRRTHPLEIVARVSGGELHVNILYSRQLHREPTMRALADGVGAQLQALIAHCAAQTVPGYTPSDFPLARLTPAGLDALLDAHPDAEDVYPLSHAQKGLLFHATRGGSDASYLVQLSIALAGRLDAEAFAESWRRVVQRHAALRTSFAWEGVSEPLQIVHRRVDAPMQIVDWRGRDERPDGGRDRSLDDWLAARRAEGLDLRQAPLHRFTLLRLEDERYAFVWTYHHILLDGWSTSNVLREVLADYVALTTGAGAAGAAAGLPAPRYRDYIAWLAARPWEQTADYWRRTLDGVTRGTRVALPAPDARIPAAPRAAHADALLVLDARDSADLASLASRLRITTNAVLQGAWGLVLARYAASDDVLFGVTVAGRPYDLPEVERRVGLFINTLPVRIRVRPARRVRAYLDAVHRGQQEMLEHDHAPLVEIQRLCDVAAPETLFDSILVFENYPTRFELAPLAGVLRVESLRTVEQTNYPLTVVVGTYDGGELRIKLVYDPAAFCASDIDQVLQHLRDTLRWMAREPDARLGDRPLASASAPAPAAAPALASASASEAAAATATATASATADATADAAGSFAPARADAAWAAWDAPIHHLFERQAAQRPHAVAIVDEERAVSYACLNRRANRIARRLVARGVRPGGFVAICLERSADMLAAVLGVLKAGAAYIPIDTRFPAPRIRLMAAAADCVLTDISSHAQFAPDDVRTLDLDAEPGWLSSGAAGNLTMVPASGDQVAYLMYTSGSSGQPKGTLVTHRNVTRLFAAAFASHDGQAGGVWSFFHSLAFDFSVWEIFGALLTGGRLVVTPYWMARSPDRFAELLSREQVSVLSQTPSAFQQLLTMGNLDDGPDDALAALRWVIFGGEALRMRPLRAFLPRLEAQGVRLLNMYGITETTVHVTHRLMTAADAEAPADRSQIGRALPDLQVHLLDRQLSPAPSRVTGEIFVGGPGVALGYAGAARLTAERFLPDPFGTTPGGRLYRSGDLGRAWSAGEIEYLGRADDQVKVRGFRIEPDEVRFHLVQDDQVRDAVVRLAIDRAGDGVLAAYVVPAEGQLSVSALFARLRAALPPHMVPAAIRVLDRFPLTPNGKIDLAALPAVAESGPRQEQRFVPPQTWTQELMADVWRDVLDLASIGIHDDFFTLGGDSIKALRVVGRLRTLGLMASTEALFAHPTIAALGRVVSPAASSPGTAASGAAAIAAADEASAGASALAASASATATAAADGSTVMDASGALDAEATFVDGPWPDGVVDLYPVTQLQLGMLYHAAEESSAARPYHNVSLFTLRGAFDERRFRGAVAALVAAHPVLRTSFDLETWALPMQRVHRVVPVPVTVAHLEGLETSAQRDYAARWIARERDTPFALDRAPLLRFHAAVCADDLFYLGLTEHHAILDGWSVASMLTELFQLYVSGTPERSDGARDASLGAVAAAPTGGTSEASGGDALGVDAIGANAASAAAAPYDAASNLFRDYVRLERAALASEALRAEVEAYLDECPRLQLPVRRDPAPPPAEAATIRKTRVTLDAVLTARVKALARDVQAPLKSVMLAAHVAVLGLLANTDDVLTGLVTHGRPEREGGESALGLFLNTLPLRVRVRHRSWRAWIRELFDEERRLLPLRRYPLAAMRTASGEKPALSTAFNYVNFHVYERLQRDAPFDLVDSVVHEETDFALLTDVSLLSHTGDLDLTLSYRSDLLSDRQAAEAAALYVRVLTQMADDPSASCLAPLVDAPAPRPPVRLSETDPADLQALVVAANGPARRDTIALVDGARHVTYRALLREASRLAHTLATAGVGPETPVVVLLPKSAEWVTAAFAVWLAGGVYVPVDPADPADRVQYIVRDTGARAILTDARGAALVQGASDALVIDAGASAARARAAAARAARRAGGAADVDSATGHDGPAVAAAAPARVDPANLAYIIYTSGSTGRPKGVALHHAALANLLAWQVREMPIAARRILQYAAPGFDVSVQELMTGLAGANTLVIVPPDVRRDFLTLAGLAAEEQAECLFAPYTVINALLLAAASGRPLEALSIIVNAGEALLTDDGLRRFVARGGALYNHYGPTESHVVTACRVPAADAGARVSIGWGIDGTELLVLDRWLRRLPIGARGELCIDSPGVARAYHRAPRLTAERFVPHPQPPDTRGERLFRTGDLGDRDAAGALWFVGRADTQVKVRGYRIELDEVRHALLRHPAVRDAVVALAEVAAEPDLCAYIVSDADAALDPSALQAFVQQTLPAYMTPAAFVRIAEVPITRNGKIDFARLPAPGGAPAPASGADDDPPLDEAIEAPLAAIWAEVLAGDPPARLSDDFLRLGGSSIALLHLQLKIQARFGVRVSIAALAARATLDGMSRAIEAAVARSASSLPADDPPSCTAPSPSAPASSSSSSLSSSCAADPRQPSAPPFSTDSR